MKSDKRVARQVGGALRRLREQRGVRQYILADTCGVTRGMLSSFENGRSCPALPTLVRVLRTLNCSAEEFGRLLGPWGAA